MLTDLAISDTYRYANNYKLAQSRPLSHLKGIMTTSSRVYIFDTTLRDGEQAPGCSMTTSEKVRMAGKLAELGVDIMEAGFPIASTGDFEAVQAVSQSLPVKVAALARCTALDI